MYKRVVRFCSLDRCASPALLRLSQGQGARDDCSKERDDSEAGGRARECAIRVPATATATSARAGVAARTSTTCVVVALLLCFFGCIVGCQGGKFRKGEDGVRKGRGGEQERR